MCWNEVRSDTSLGYLRKLASPPLLSPFWLYLHLLTARALRGRIEVEGVLLFDLV